MKQLLLIVFFAASFISQGLSQDGERGERLEALRVAFITKQLQLTSDEAKKFWPIYDNYQGEMRKLIKEHRQKGGSELEMEEKVLGLRKKYKPELTRVISEEKFDKLLRAERTWGDMLRKEIQRRREDGPGPAGRGPRGGGFRD